MQVKNRIYAAIDIGTNSVKLLIANVRNSKITPLLERIVITRLGKNIIKHYKLRSEQVDKTIKVLKEFIRECRSRKAINIFTICTQAIRSAKNAKLFIDKCNFIGIQPKIISGSQEARLSYLGATFDLGTGATVLDIGGGSTEIVNLHSAKSLKIGAVTLTERFIKSDPPSVSEISIARRYISTILRRVSDVNVKKLIGVGGTITTLAAISSGSFAKIHKTTLSRSQIEDIFRTLSKLALVKRLKIKCLEPERADIILAGTLILIEIMKVFKVEKIIVSTKGIRYGSLIDKLS